MDLATLSGRTLGQYELRALVGTGGMSAVYRAHQPSLNRNVAVKVLSSTLATDPTYAQRFDNEAKTVATLEHNNIIPVYDYGTEDGLSYIVMRLLTGGTLGERIEYRAERGLPMPSFGEVVTLAKEMAKALSYAHSRGVIHRDIKASNVMFDGQGDPYLVDFGIAQVLRANMALTAENVTIGTPTYMAPEQWRDEDLSPATDQYALAVLLFYALTGRLPFYGSNPPALMQKHLNEAPPAVHTHRADLPERVSTVLQKALAKNADNRYLTVSAFAESFEAAFEGDTGSPTDFFRFQLGGRENTAPHRAPTLPAEPAAPPPAAPTVESTPPAPANPAPLPRTASEQPAPMSVAPQSSTPAQAPPPSPAPARGFVTGVGIGLGVLALLTAVALFTYFALFTESSSTTRTVTPAAAANNPTNTPTPLSGAIRINPSPGATAITPVRGGTAVAAAPVDVTAGMVLYQSPVGDVVRAVAVNPSGVIFSGHADGTVRAWLDGTGGTPRVLSQHSDVVNDIDLSADGSVMVTGSDDRSLHVWDGLTGDYRGALLGHTSAVRGVAISPDGTLAASAAEDATVRLWDVNAGTQLTTLREGGIRYLDVTFSPDGTLIAAGDNDGNIFLFDVESRSLQRTLRGHTDSVRSVDFSDDGALLVSASTDDTIRLWEVENGVISATLRGHNNDVWRAVLSPDASRIASGGRDNNLRLWNVGSSDPVASFDDHAAWVLGLAFSPDGDVLVSGGGDGSVRTWAVE